MRPPLFFAATCTALLLAGSAEARGRVLERAPVYRGDDEIYLQVQNEFYGLGWGVRVWQDAGGFHRTTSVTDLATQRRLEQTSAVSSVEARVLWAKLESLRCWTGPKSRDWAPREADFGTVRLARHGRRELTFTYFEHWKVAEVIERFGAVAPLRMAAREKGLGHES